jgi:hypothetical protein
LQQQVPSCFVRHMHKNGHFVNRTLGTAKGASGSA